MTPRAYEIKRALEAGQLASQDKSALMRRHGDLFPVASPHFLAAVLRALELAQEGDELIEVRYQFSDGWIADLPTYTAHGLRRIEQLKSGVYRFAIEAAPTPQREPLKLRPEDRA